MSNAIRRNYVAEFREAFALGIDNIVRASRIYVEAIDDNPKQADEFRAAFADTIPGTAWSGFEAVGRKWMHPKLLMGGGGKYASKIKRLPYSAQERIFSGERFELLTSTGDKIKVDVREVTPEQVEQLIDGTRIRTLAEQRAWLESRKGVVAAGPTEVLPYTIEHGKVHFRRGTTLNRAELRRLLTEL